MPSANRCPECRAAIHPFAATCEACGADLDVHRRRRADRAMAPPRLSLPHLGSDVTDLVVVTLILLLFALFAPLIGAVLALFIVWHANQNGPISRRNIAIVCAGLAIFNLLDPQVLLPHVL
jgi:hypothetical protein